MTASDRLRREAAGRLIRRDLALFAEHALRTDGLRPAAHHRLMLRELAAVARGETRRLMLFMPPGSAKSLYASVLFPAWFLAGGGGRQANVLAASHTAVLAESFSRKVRAVVRRETLLGLGVVGEAAVSWGTSRGGSYRAAGVGAGIAGFRADLGLIDDPVRSRADADSAALRARVWDWYRADFLTRLRPGARQVLVMTRWHEDDLAGRLLATGGESWRVVKLPAVAGTDDPLGRPSGALLWEDDAYGYAAQLRETRAFYERSGGMRDWSALYQQEPRAAEGALFRVERIPVIDAVPASAEGARTAVRAWDLAATAQTGTADPDWTVGVLMLRGTDGRCVVADVVRLRGGPEAVQAALLGTASRDGREVMVHLPQDPGQAGKAQAAHLTGLLAGYRVACSPESGSKATRAAPLAAQCNVGNVAMLRGAWNAAWLEELRSFPDGAKDDQVDASSRAFDWLASAPPPARVLRLPFMGR